MHSSRFCLLLVILATPAWGGESQDQRTTLRIRPGLAAGFKISTAQLAFKSDTAHTDIRVDALPAAYIEADFWPTEAVGFHAMLTTGFGAEIDGLLSNRVDYNHHEFVCHGLYRWFLGPRLSSASIGLELGLHGRRQTVQEQRPAVLLDRTLIGPATGFFFTLPLLESRLWFTTEVHGSLPFFIRESPADSGDPKSFWKYGAALSAGVRLTGPWFIQLDADFTQTSIRFDGAATRALGVNDVETDDFFVTYGLALRYAIIAMGPR